MMTIKCLYYLFENTFRDKVDVYNVCLGLLVVLLLLCYQGDPSKEIKLTMHDYTSKNKNETCYYNYNRYFKCDKIIKHLLWLFFKNTQNENSSLTFWY